MHAHQPAHPPTHARAPAHPQATAYWRSPFPAISNCRQLVEYVVLDIEPLSAPGEKGRGGQGGGSYAQGGGPGGGGASTSGRWLMSEAQVGA